jgi:ribosomal protein L37AE/L43A
MSTPTTALKFSQAELLERVGATLRGHNRADCPWCGGRRTISYADEVYFCHRCGAKGNAVSLARELGLARRLSSAEARALRLERERADRAAHAFLAEVKGARFGLGGLHIELLKLRHEARERLKVNHDDVPAWETLAHVHTELPRARAAYVLLSDGTVGDRLAWLEANEGTRREMADRILQAGGVPTYDGKWVEVE